MSFTEYYHFPCKKKVWKVIFIPQSYSKDKVDNYCSEKQRFAEKEPNSMFFKEFFFPNNVDI